MECKQSMLGSEFEYLYKVIGLLQCQMLPWNRSYNRWYTRNICHICQVIFISLLWRHNGCGGVSNHQPQFVYSAVYSGTDHRKRQSSTSLAFVRGIHRGPVNSPHKGPVTRKRFPFDDVIMECKQPMLGNEFEYLYKVTGLLQCQMLPWNRSYYRWYTRNICDVYLLFLSNHNA